MSTDVPGTVLVDGIATLVTNDPASGKGPLGEISDAALVIEGERVAWAGPRASAPAADVRIDADGRCVIPGFVDSHSHVVFAGDRSREFAARMSGTPYSAGGIRTTVAA
ncbi:MAG TPA: amidohydrolase family protein, partial [Nocardiopsis listeri]|uniref:amidohydrolase family protein n=1 Tax=Nocardiopsis listeri TaxID=53440 RepID=UPI001D893F84